MLLTYRTSSAFVSFLVVAGNSFWLHRSVFCFLVVARNSFWFCLLAYHSSCAAVSVFWLRREIGFGSTVYKKDSYLVSLIERESTSKCVSPYRLGTFEGIVKQNMPGKLFFFVHQPVPLCCAYVLCTRGHRNILLIEDLLRLRAQNHKPTMTSAASPRSNNPKIVESPASMVHASSSYACTEDGYFKHPHTASIDGDIWLDSCWFFVGFGVGGRLTCK